MRKLVLGIVAGLILSCSYTTQANAQMDRRETTTLDSRKLTKEERRARKQEAQMDKEYRKMDKENYKQLKKMGKESRKERRARYDVNSRGNVFGL